MQKSIAEILHSNRKSGLVNWISKRCYYLSAHWLGGSSRVVSVGSGSNRSRKLFISSVPLFTMQPLKSGEGNCMWILTVSNLRCELNLMSLSICKLISTHTLSVWGRRSCQRRLYSQPKKADSVTQWRCNLLVGIATALEHSGFVAGRSAINRTQCKTWSK